MGGELILIRGLPGSGKTTIAKGMVERGEADAHVETDFWFTSVDGTYRFDPEALSQNHHKCQKVARALLEAGNRVVVSNTFTRRWEMQPYIDMGFPVREVVAVGDFPNVHGVPKEAVERMRDRWED